MGRSWQEGRLLLGHEVSRVRGSGAAGRSAPGQHGCGSRSGGKAAPEAVMGQPLAAVMASVTREMLRVSRLPSTVRRRTGDFGIAEAGRDPQDRLLRGGAG